MRTSGEIEEPGSQQRLADLEYLKLFLEGLHEEFHDTSDAFDPSAVFGDGLAEFRWHLELHFSDSTRRVDDRGMSPRQQCAAQLQSMLAKTLLKVFQLQPHDHFADQAFKACIASWAASHGRAADLHDLADEVLKRRFIDPPQPH